VGNFLGQAIDLPTGLLDEIDFVFSHRKPREEGNAASIGDANVVQ
jgi:hypothetical protein